jgi:hypothetical protein
MSNVSARFGPNSAILLALLACTSKPPQPTNHQPVPKQEIEQAQEDYASCLRRGAADLDDGKLATVSLAREVRSYCIPEFERIVSLQSKDMNPEAKEMFRQKAVASELQEAAAAVLHERSKRQAPSQ